jgi:hypothetical protein
LKKFTVLTGILTIALLLTVGSLSAQAATKWHVGAPKVVRGTWRTAYTHNHHYNPFSYYFRDTFTVNMTDTAGGTTMYNHHHHHVSNGSGWGANGQLHYRQLTNHTYQLRSYVDVKHHKLPLTYRITLNHHNQQLNLTRLNGRPAKLGRFYKVAN